MVLALGPKFRIPIQNFKCQRGLCGGVVVLCERQVATCHSSQLLGYPVYLGSKPGHTLGGYSGGGPINWWTAVHLPTLKPSMLD